MVGKTNKQKEKEYLYVGTAKKKQKKKHQSYIENGQKMIEKGSYVSIIKRNQTLLEIDNTINT